MMTPTEEILAEMKNARRLYERGFEPLLREYELTQLQMDILLFLHNNPGYDTAQQICEMRGFAKSNVSRAVEELVRRNWLRRGQRPGDRRTVHLALTAEAAPCAGRAARQQRAYLARVSGVLTPEERAEAARLFDKLCGALREMDGTAEEARL